MAWVTDTATNITDLLARLRDFLTTHPDLVAAGQQWQVVGGTAAGAISANEFVSFKGRGLAGDDEIYFSAQAWIVPASNFYNLAFRGHTAYNPALPTLDPPGANSNYVSILGVNSPIKYWFIANGRCFKVITRINGRYDAAYVGFILPEHLPGDWSYPLFIGASYLGRNAVASMDAYMHSNFWNPRADDASNVSNSQAYLFSPMQAWVPIRNSIQEYNNVDDGRVTAPWVPTMCNNNWRSLLDGTRWLQRGQLAAVGWGRGNPDRGSPSPNVPERGQFYGGFDGVFYTPSFGAAAEQLATVNGIDHLLIPNVFRTGDGQFAAFALE
jgi:hypothetical protein